MTRTLKLPLVFFAAALAAACANKLINPPPPQEGAPGAGPLKSIAVYFSNAASGESGPAVDGLSLYTGDTVYLSAQGRDDKDRPIKINPSWRVSKPELAELSPEFGDLVGLKGLREGPVEIQVECQGVKLVIRHIFIQ